VSRAIVFSAKPVMLFNKPPRRNHDFHRPPRRDAWPTILIARTRRALYDRRTKETGACCSRQVRFIAVCRRSQRRARGHQFNLMEEPMKDKGFGRREFLKSAVAGGAAAATGTAGVALPQTAQAQPAAAPVAAGYAFLNLDEAAFIETLVDHMVPADDLTPKGTDLGINIYIDRALAGGWGKGDRLYAQGPWKPGVPSQGYQLPLTPAQLFRAGIEATNTHCRKTYGKNFDKIDETQRQEVLLALSTGKISFDSGLPVRVFWGALYQTVMEGMFADPIHGGNKNKAGWKLVGFPGAIAVHRENVIKYRDKKFPTDPQSIADMS
jgi:gluconate 2-dehydrogenase gamma chain